MSKEKDSGQEDPRTEATEDCIFFMASQGIPCRKIAKELYNNPNYISWSKTTINNKINKKGFPFKGGQICRSPSGQRTSYGIHNYCIYFKILRKPKGFNANYILRVKRYPFRVVDMNTWEKIIFYTKHASIHITPNALLVYPHRMDSFSSPVYAVNAANQIALNLTSFLEGLLGIKITRGGAHFIDINSQHIVLKNDDLYNLLKGYNIHKIEDLKGKKRIVLDESNGELEIEAIHRQYALHDITRINEEFQAVLEGLTNKEIAQAVLVNQEKLFHFGDALVEIQDNVKSIKEHQDKLVDLVYYNKEIMLTLQDIYYVQTMQTIPSSKPDYIG